MKVISNNQHKGLDDVFTRVVFHLVTKTSRVYTLHNSTNLNIFLKLNMLSN